MFSLNPYSLKTPTDSYKTYFSNTNQKMITVPNTDFTATPKPMNISFQPNNHEYIVLVDTQEITKQDSYEETEDPGDDGPIDYIPQIYVGTLTVLGLYILYRLLNKR